MATCKATTVSGAACRANARGATGWCRWHDPDPAVRVEHRAQSRAGGIAKAAAVVTETAAPLATDPAVRALDLATAHGVRGVLAAMLRALTTLSVDVRLANALGNLATAQRGTIEQADIIARLDALEAAERQRTPRFPLSRAR